MRILRHPTDVPDSLRDCVLAIGNFDGVHRGHQAVLSRAAEIAAGAQVPLGLLTFEPHPRSFFRPDEPPFRLTPFRSKARLLAALGVDLLVEQRFDTAFSHVTAEEFVDRILVAEIGVSHVVVGYDFVFGHKRGGDTDFLKERARRHGVGVTIANPVASADGEVYSSTRIREYLAEGKPGHAAALLGRPFEIEGRIQGGDQRGRTIGFPTANVDLGDYLRPALGVYAVRAGLEAAGTMSWHDGVANLGNRPTVDGTKLLLETFLFNFDRQIYGLQMRVALVEFLRPEMKFDGLASLKAQIAEDCLQARSILRTRTAGAP